MKKICSSGHFRDFYKYDAIYVDKTSLIYDLISKIDKAFISRPRRFGKSLTLDTIGKLFEYGVDPYFKGTWVYDKWNEPKYPVLRLDFATFDSSDIEKFSAQFLDKINDFVLKHNLKQYKEKQTLASSLDSLLNKLSDLDKNIVILIDEYDCQLTANINNENLYNQFKILLRNIYAVFKSNDCIKFLGITGVTRLKDVTLFSVGSDIKDITNNHDYSQLIGFTREEIKTYYIDYLKLGASIENQCSVEEVTDEQVNLLLDKIAAEYDGYCFDEYYKKKVFSTWSVSNFLENIANQKKVIFREYWYANGGVPTILANYLQKHSLKTINNINEERPISVSSEDFINPTDLLTIDENVLMCQTGYLTLNSPTTEEEILLRVPNNEVKKALLKLVTSNIFGGKLKIYNDNCINVIEKGSGEEIIIHFNTILNTVCYDNYSIKCEADLQQLLFLYLKATNKKVIAENHSSKGRADLTVDTDNRRIVIELKYANDESETVTLLKDAIEQIKSRDYGNTLPVKNELLRIAAVFNAAPKVRAFTKYQIV